MFNALMKIPQRLIHNYYSMQRKLMSYFYDLKNNMQVGMQSLSTLSCADIFV
jgi:hypothetical protein